MRTILVRLSGFAFFPLLSLVMPLLLLPLIAQIVGQAGVSSVVSGQSIGAFAATALTWGWNFEGPVVIALAKDSDERARVYLQSMRDRLVLAVFVLPLAALIAAVVAVPGFAVDAVAMALANGLAGLSPAWFCIGLGQPRLLAQYDTIPRFVATLASVPLLLYTRQVWLYVVVLVITTLVALVAFHRRFSPGGAWLPTNPRESLKGIWAQRHAAGINIAASAYASTPAPIATVTSPAAASATLASADTVYRFSLAAVVALGNAFQSWVLDPTASRRRVRQSAALIAHLVIGLVGLLAFVLLGPWATGILFGGQTQATTEIAFYYGLAFLFISLGTPLTRNILIPAGRQSTILKWTLVSALSGLTVMVVAGITGNPAKIALGMALSEALLVLGLLVPALRELAKQEAGDV